MDSFLSQEHLREVKHKQFRQRFELKLSIPFRTTITVLLTSPRRQKTSKEFKFQSKLDCSIVYLVRGGGLWFSKVLAISLFSPKKKQKKKQSPSSWFKNRPRGRLIKWVVFFLGPRVLFLFFYFFFSMNFISSLSPKSNTFPQRKNEIIHHELLRTSRPDI